jgi:hypothetical protein
MTYFLLGARPPISYLGSKQGFGPTIAACIGLSPRQRPAGIVLGEVGPMAAVHAVLGGASGSAAEVAEAVWVMGHGDMSQPPRLAAQYARPEGDADGRWKAPPRDWLSRRLDRLPHPRAAEVAAIIRGWAGEEPRPLWERLRREGWPSLMPVAGGRWLGPQGVEEVARWAFCASRAFRNGEPESGYKDYEKCFLDGTRGSPAEPCSALSNNIAALPTFPPLAVWQGSADALALPDDLSGWVVYLDGPYWGDGSRKITGYPHGTMSREGQIRLALDYHRRGAVVAVSECVGLAGELGTGWHEVEITHGRKGQKRTFSVQSAEILTMNRPPQHAPHRGQVTLFPEA